MTTLPSNHPSVWWCAAATAAAFINGEKVAYVNAANRARMKSHVSYRRQSKHEGIHRHSIGLQRTEKEREREGGKKRGGQSDRTGGCVRTNRGN